MGLIVWICLGAVLPIDKACRQGEAEGQNAPVPPWHRQPPCSEQVCFQVQMRLCFDIMIFFLSFSLPLFLRGHFILSCLVASTFLSFRNVFSYPWHLFTLINSFYVASIPATTTSYLFVIWQLSQFFNYSSFKQNTNLNSVYIINVFRYLNRTRGFCPWKVGARKYFQSTVIIFLKL